MKAPGQVCRRRRCARRCPDAPRWVVHVDEQEILVGRRYGVAGRHLAQRSGARSSRPCRSSWRRFAPRSHGIRNAGASAASTRTALLRLSVGQAVGDVDHRERGGEFHAASADKAAMSAAATGIRRDCSSVTLLASAGAAASLQLSRRRKRSQTVGPSAMPSAAGQAAPMIRTSTNPCRAQAFLTGAKPSMNCTQALTRRRRRYRTAW